MRRGWPQLARAVLGAYGLALGSLIVMTLAGMVLIGLPRITDLLFGDYHGILVIALTVGWFFVIRTRIR